MIPNKNLERIEWFALIATDCKLAEWLLILDEM